MQYVYLTAHTPDDLGIIIRIPTGKIGTVGYPPWRHVKKALRECIEQLCVGCDSDKAVFRPVTTKSRVGFQQETEQLETVFGDTPCFDHYTSYELYKFTGCTLEYHRSRLQAIHKKAHPLPPSPPAEATHPLTACLDKLTQRRARILEMSDKFKECVEIKAAIAGVEDSMAQVRVLVKYMMFDNDCLTRENKALRERLGE